VWYVASDVKNWSSQRGQCVRALVGRSVFYWQRQSSNYSSSSCSSWEGCSARWSVKLLIVTSIGDSTNHAHWWCSSHSCCRCWQWH